MSNSIEELENAKRKAWEEYERFRIPADEAYKKYQEADESFRSAVLYEKAKRQVMRDLIKAAGNLVETDSAGA